MAPFSHLTKYPLLASVLLNTVSYRWSHDVYGTSLYPCHLQLLSCPHCRSVKIWSLPQCLCTAILVHEATVVTLQLSALLIVSACRDGAVCLWNLHSPHCPLMQWRTTDGVYFSALSISGSRVFGAGRLEYSPPSPCLLPTFVI